MGRDPFTTMFGPKPCRKCGRDHYPGACPEPPPAPATIIEHPALRTARELSAFRQGFTAGALAARQAGRKADPEYAELQRFALEQADRADAAEAALAALTPTNPQEHDDE